jgi:hypothetical protein
MPQSSAFSYQVGFYRQMAIEQHLLSQLQSVLQASDVGLSYDDHKINLKAYQISNIVVHCQ